MQDTELSDPFVKTMDVGVRGLAEKATGQDLHPEGLAEKAANWMGLIKNPAKIAKAGLKPSTLIKAIAPTGKETLKGLGAGTALQLAEDGQFGPMGTLASAIVGDLSGEGLAGLGKALLHPKKTIAKGFSLLHNSKSAIRKDLAQEAKKSEYTKDIGTLTGNNMVQMIQSKLVSSGLTGKPLEELRKTITKEVVDDYKNIADTLGKSRFESLHEAGEAAKQGITKIRDADLAETRTLYNNATKSLKEDSSVLPKNLAQEISNIEPIPTLFFLRRLAIPLKDSWAVCFTCSCSSSFICSGDLLPESLTICALCLKSSNSIFCACFNCSTSISLLVFLCSFSLSNSVFKPYSLPNC